MCDVWEYICDADDARALLIVKCKHCMKSVLIQKKSERATAQLNSCSRFKSAINGVDDIHRPHWFDCKKLTSSIFNIDLASTDHNRPSMPHRSQSTVQSYAVARLPHATQQKIHAHMAMHLCMIETSLSRVEDAYLLKALQLLNPDISLPTQKTHQGRSSVIVMTRSCVNSTNMCHRRHTIA